MLIRTALFVLSSAFIVSTSLHAKEIPGMVAAHNKARAPHKLPPMKWSPALEKNAQEWANHLAKYNRCKMKHRPSSGPFRQKYGENLYWASAVRWDNGKRDVQKISAPKVVQHWDAEKKYFNYRINQCFPGQMCGHYTQVVWRASTQVGCAKAVCSDKTQVWVCNYNPGGNYVGKRPY